MALLAEVQFGREVCGDLASAESREWLVTNGLGGFASGTVAGSSTRRYHGLLIAALQPPVGRTVLVSGVDESARYLDRTYSLATNRWAGESISPSGYLNIESFHLEGTKPVWRYALADAMVEKRVWMKQGENTTYVEYTVVRGGAPVELTCKVLVNYRDYHSTTKANGWQMRIEACADGLRVRAFESAAPFFLRSAKGRFEQRHEWYRDYLLAVERERGLDEREDRLLAAEFQCRLAVGESVALVFSTEERASLDGGQARAEQSNHEGKLFKAWQARHAEACESEAEDEPGWLWQLVPAADQFLVKRPLENEPDGQSVIAGYPWFCDWGRDTMIALPGLTLAMGRAPIARRILRSFARYVDGGMLPNNFPDAGGKPEYNTIDATLWYFEAARQYSEATRDLETVRALYPVLETIVEAHLRGTRYNIKADP
ncbi:MAG TPA: glycogen debranching enzyme N-terminal domain-containing protein, partial [Candidatus Acidoferrum sp.]